MRNYKRGVRIVLVLHINRLADKSMQARKETMGILIKDQRGQIYFKLKGSSITWLGNLCVSLCMFQAFLECFCLPRLAWHLIVWAPRRDAN